MAKPNCSACDELREKAPNLIVNGLGDTECTSLANNTGLNPSSGNDDCDDLHNLNDCLIGNMEQEIDAYDVCDWKEYMRKYVENSWTVFKGVICATCGLWTNVKNLWKAIQKLQCQFDYLAEGATFQFNETQSSGGSYLVAGKGVDYTLRKAADPYSTDVTLTYVAGGLVYATGSLRTYIENFTDANGVTKDGNSVWNFSSSSFSLPIGGELLYEIRIKKSEYPQIKALFPGHLHSAAGANTDFQARMFVFTEGSYAYGQHGSCNSQTGTPQQSGYSSGHRVPDGWIYLQCRLLHQENLNVSAFPDGSGANKQGSEISPNGFIGIRMDIDKIDC